MCSFFAFFFLKYLTSSFIFWRKHVLWVLNFTYRSFSAFHICQWNIHRKFEILHYSVFQSFLAGFMWMLHGTCSVASHSLATPWTIDCQAPLSVGFSRYEYWCKLPFPPPGNLCDSGIKFIKLVSPVSLVLHEKSMADLDLYINCLNK